MGKVEREEGWGRAKVDVISDARSSGDADGQSTFPPFVADALVVGVQFQMPDSLENGRLLYQNGLPRTRVPLIHSSHKNGYRRATADLHAIHSKSQGWIIAVLHPCPFPLGPCDPACL